MITVTLVPFFWALISAVLMGIFYLLDLWFGEKGVYTRPTHAMIVSSLVPIISSIVLMAGLLASDHLYLPPIELGLIAFGAGALLIWGNWFYFQVMFPAGEREVAAVEGATELTLYESATPAVVLVLWLVASVFIISPDTISLTQGVAVFVVVGCLVAFALAGDGFTGLTRWSYRVKLLGFAFLVSCSQLTQDLILGVLKFDLSYNHIEAVIAILPWVGFGMGSGIIVWWWKSQRPDGTLVSEGTLFCEQWRGVLYKYAVIILVAEVIAILSYAAVARSYSEEHVAISQAIAGTFPILVFPISVWLQRRGILSEDDGRQNFFLKLFWLMATVVAVATVVLL